MLSWRNMILGSTHTFWRRAKKFSKKRNHINQFVRKYGEIDFRPLDERNLDLAFSVEERWLSEAEQMEKSGAGSEAGDLQVEKEIIKSALENFKSLASACSMTGGILFVCSEPAAFCIASSISRNVVDVHFEKCLSPFAKDGGYAVINNQFSKSVRAQYINREEDLGLEGLRKAKLSYYPDIILQKYNVLAE